MFTFQDAITSAFPEAMISDYEDLIALMTNDEKDRHVLAAAVKEKLDLIVTFNLRDFKPKDLSKWGIRAVHPQDYLITLYSMNPAIVMAKISQIAQKKRVGLDDVIIDLGRALPLFSYRLFEDMGKME